MITNFMSGSAPQPLTIEDLLDLNQHLDDEHYFSILRIIEKSIFKRFAKVGYDIPIVTKDGKRTSIDISVAKQWSRYCSKYDIALSKYCLQRDLIQPNNDSIQKVNVYDKKLLLCLQSYIDTIWLKDKAPDYLLPRFGEGAIEALNKVLFNLNNNS